MQRSEWMYVLFPLSFVLDWRRAVLALHYTPRLEACLHCFWSLCLALLSLILSHSLSFILPQSIGIFVSFMEFF